MSALTSASLREAVLDAVDSLADMSVGDTAADPDDVEVSARLASDEREPADDPAPPVTTELSLDDAVDRAVVRLKAAGELDATTQAALLSILDSTNPEDWPAAIDAFTASLEKHRPARRTAAAAEVPTPGPQAVPTPGPQAVPPTADVVLPVAFAPPTEPARLTAVAEARPLVRDVVPEPVVQPSPPAPAAVPETPEMQFGGSPVVAEGLVAGDDHDLTRELLTQESPTQEPARSEEPAAVDPPSPGPAPLAVRSACFASRVQAWGKVDRFPESAFRPGQDVIVYFELERPATRREAGGHATSIDTLFRLVAADGRLLGQWDFEPIDELCHAPRSDYFARYIVRIPHDAPPGPCRLDFVVSDRVAGTSTPASLDLEIR